ncbi:MAG: acyl-CoA carboxylase subunit beta, partial [Minwuiales bacterium]|nr:acyl-CoA carboxylase subunit beta [Minwuiales bacterium]
RARDRFEKRGQILPRERVARLLDRGAPFLELSTLAGYRIDVDDPDKTVPGGSHIAGIGLVSGVRAMIVATDSGIDAGAIGAMGREKLMRAQEIALENKLPFIHLVESAGANLLKYRVEGFVAGGGIFYNLARLSAAGLPVVTVLHGSSTAGGAYMPGLSDYVIMVRGRAKAFLAGPPLLKAATGEVATDEELGGAEMHATVSGLAEYLAENDTDGLRLAREVVAKLNWNAADAPAADRGREPRYDPDEIAGVVPMDYRKPYDVHEVIARIVDGSDFLDFKPLYGTQTVCGHGEIEGHAVGIIGNNGPIDNEGATKAAQFIQLCCQSNTPIVYLQNTTGYMVGKQYEAGGMIKHGSKMIQAVSNASVPQITLMIGASFGAGNYGMCGRAYEPRFCFSWPNLTMAVMGPEQAATTMSIVTEASLKRRGQEVDYDELAKREKQIVDMFAAQSDALHATARLLDDGIIDPRDSRKVLALTLAVCREAEARTVHPSTFGVARM